MNFNTVQLKKGLKDSLPIALGYLPIAFTVGMAIVAKGISVLMNALFSLSASAIATVTTAKLMVVNSDYLGAFLALFLLNLRHIVLSLALSQRLENNVSLWKRFLIGIGITDENFAFAIRQKGEITADYYIGVTILPWFAWIIGTIVGSVVGNVLPEVLTVSMNMAIYAMLLYALVPGAKESRPALYTIVIAGFLSTAVRYIKPYFVGNKVAFFVLSPSMSLVFGSILSAGLIAAIFPKEDDGEDTF